MKRVALLFSLLLLGTSLGACALRPAFQPPLSTASKEGFIRGLAGYVLDAELDWSQQAGFQNAAPSGPGTKSIVAVDPPAASAPKDPAPSAPAPKAATPPAGKAKAPAKAPPKAAPGQAPGKSAPVLKLVDNQQRRLKQDYALTLNGHAYKGRLMLASDSGGKRLASVTLTFTALGADDRERLYKAFSRLLASEYQAGMLSREKVPLSFEQLRVVDSRGRSIRLTTSREGSVSLVLLGLSH